MDKSLYKSINNALHRADVDEVIAYRESGNREYPPHINTNAKRQRYSNSFDKLDVDEDRNLVLIYDLNANPPVILRVLRPNEIQQKLIELYDAPHSLGLGIQAFTNVVQSRFLNVTRKQVETFLKQQEPYQLTKRQFAPRYPTKKYQHENQAWACDLVDLQNFSPLNHNRKYIFSIIDLKTRRCILKALNNKNGGTVRDAFQQVLQTNPNPRLLLSDRGKEFTGQIFQTLLQQHRIKHLPSKSAIPNPDIEGLNAQIRKKISALFVKRMTLVWYDALDAIQESINSNQNWLSREKADEKNHRRDALADAQEERAGRFNVGDIVRVRQIAFNAALRERRKAGWDKNTHVVWSVRKYVIAEKKRYDKRNSLYWYKLNYLNGQPVVEGPNNRQVPYREIDLQLAPMTRQERNNQAMTIDESNRINRI